MPSSSLRCTRPTSLERLAGRPGPTETRGHPHVDDDDRRALLAQPADSLTVTGVVVDPAGKPVSDVEIVLAGPEATDRSVPTLARSMTDDRGAFRLVVNPKRLMGIASRSGDLGLHSRPDGRHPTNRARGQRRIAAGPTDPGCPFQTDGDDSRSRRPSDCGRTCCPRRLRKQRPRHVRHARRLAGAIDGRDRCRWGGHTFLLFGDDRSHGRARDRSRHRPARFPTS